MSSLAAVVVGVIGYFIVRPWQQFFPYLPVIASSSFICVAVADLIPQLQHRLTLRETAAQLLGWSRASRSSFSRSASCAGARDQR